MMVCWLAESRKDITQIQFFLDRDITDFSELELVIPVMIENTFVIKYLDKELMEAYEAMTKTNVVLMYI